MTGTDSVTRQQRIKRATPVWANRCKINCIYEQARRLGPAYHVDHIVPLNSKYVCGLHNEFNLRVIHYTCNLRKSNLYWEYMFNEQLKMCFLNKRQLELNL